MCFSPDQLQGPELLLTSSWTQSHTPWGGGQGLELIEPSQSCIVVTCLYFALLSLPWAEDPSRERRTPGKVSEFPNILRPMNHSGNLLSLLPPSLPTSLSLSEQWKAYWFHPALTQPGLQASLWLPDHTWSSSPLPLHPHLSYPFLLHFAPAIWPPVIP